MTRSTVLILDFGSQVTQLIARRVREIGVYCEIHPYTTSLDEIKTLAPKAIILSGGPASVLDAHAPMIDTGIFELGIPILGICYGQQLMCKLLGGSVAGSDVREFGRAMIDIVKESPLMAGIWHQGTKHKVWMSHGDSIGTLPKDFSALATSEGAPYAIIANEDTKCYGVQFHPEVTHTPDGKQLLQNFLLDVAGCHADWTMASFLEEEIQAVRKIVGTDKVVCGVSGGVDSSVVAMLLHQAIGDQLTCIFVDTGLLRKNEALEVKRFFSELNHIKLIACDESELFLSRLAGVTDPEQKRKIIGKSFIEVFEREAAKIKDARFLAQGTLYPDVIESVSVHGDASVTIKSHHNVGGLPERMNLKLVEPLRALFKDEVRALGKELGMPERMVHRHPFPGPGLAVRIPGEITQEKIDILQEADAIYIKSIEEHGLYDEIWQAFAVLLPVKSVGVMGDGRTYEYVLALRAVTSTDGMTADYYDFDHEFLRTVSTKIINRIRGVNRVVYDITSKPPGTIEWE